MTNTYRYVHLRSLTTNLIHCVEVRITRTPRKCRAIRRVGLAVVREMVEKRRYVLAEKERCNERRGKDAANYQCKGRGLARKRPCDASKDKADVLSTRNKKDGTDDA